MLIRKYVNKNMYLNATKYLYFWLKCYCESLTPPNWRGWGVAGAPPLRWPQQRIFLSLYMLTPWLTSHLHLRRAYTSFPPPAEELKAALGSQQNMRSVRQTKNVCWKSQALTAGAGWNCWPQIRKKFMTSDSNSQAMSRTPVPWRQGDCGNRPREPT